jgi:soluble lytic murein transglycosylase-like protein
VSRLAPDFQLDPDLVTAVIAVESGYRADAVSPKNAQGLMQLIPATAARFGVADPFDPAQNIRGGMMYLRFLLRLFDGDVTLAFAAYNAGEGAVIEHGGVPPYPETKLYLEKLRRYYDRPYHPMTAAVRASR